MPYLEDELKGAGDEDISHEGVPLDVVDGGGVGGEGGQVLRGVEGGRQDDFSLLSPNQEHIVIIWFEG